MMPSIVVPVPRMLAPACKQRRNLSSGPARRSPPWQRPLPTSTQNLGKGLLMDLKNRSRLSSWRDAFRSLVAAVDAAGHFDVAIMACGGLGMLLGAHLRDTGRSSIYVGGSLQMWFGIKGNRWTRDQAGVRRTLGQYLNNTNWTRPDRNTELISYARAHEGAAYWRRQ